MRWGYSVGKQDDGSSLASKPTASKLQTAQFYKQQQKQLWEQFGGRAHDVNDLNICGGTCDAMRASSATSAFI